MWVEREWDHDHSGYDRLLALPLPGWGWEYARRFPKLKSAAFAARRYAPVRVGRRDGTELVRLRRRCLEAETFGLQFFPDTSLSALETMPFWIPEVCSSSLDAAVELEARARRGGSPLRVDDIPGERHFLIGPGRRPKLIVASKGYAAQLAIEENALPVPQAVFLSLKLGAGQLVGKNLGPVEEFAQFCAGSTVKCRAVRGLSPGKLRDTIIALDGELAGVKRRRIAEVVFNEKIVRAEWDNGDDIYKKRTKRLVKKGLELMEYGYRNLL
jgi:T6SS, Transcription factor, DNA binding domain